MPAFQTLPCSALIVSYFENGADPNQIASEKPADQNPPYFPLCL